MLRAARELFSGFAPATEAIARAWPAAQTRVLHNYPKALFGLAGASGSPWIPAGSLYVGGLSRARGTLLARGGGAGGPAAASRACAWS